MISAGKPLSVAAVSVVDEDDADCAATAAGQTKASAEIPLSKYFAAIAALPPNDIIRSSRHRGPGLFSRPEDEPSPYRRNGEMLRQRGRLSEPTHCETHARAIGARNALYLCVRFD
ncbi:hypothetical protein [Tsuneonella rigui]|uniref:hypothetical protein n=1 Tax=Tsuneonella rigui TaxID=1708790 RepID=UPI0019D1E60E|nr:hypothetical protein [Tsuneonella rigui]